MKDRELVPDSQQMNEVPFKMYNDTNDITVRLPDLKEGWEMDQTLETQVHVKFTQLFYQLTVRIINLQSNK